MDMIGYDIYDNRIKLPRRRRKGYGTGGKNAIGGQSR